MQELIQMRGEQGTHSIIDITSVATKGGLFTITPLTPEEHARFFGTNHPTHQIIEEKAAELMTLRGPWQGIYALVYKDGQPNEIFFTGFSGD
ncbi:MAG TPA: hypothetical protein VF898_07585 [Chloroflexota bacterium]